MHVRMAGSQVVFQTLSVQGPNSYVRPCPALNPLPRPIPRPLQVVAHLFSSHAAQTGPPRLGKSSSITRLYKAHTVAAKFQQSLLDLVEKMERWVGWQGRVGEHPLAPSGVSHNLSHLRPGVTPCSCVA